jgi:hypothetical protein
MQELTYSITVALLPVAMLAMTVSLVYMSWKNGISPMPSSSLVCRAVTQEIIRLGIQGSIVEAGSGWGTLALYLQRHLRAVRIIGIENSMIPLGISRLAAAALKRIQPEVYKGVSFHYGNLYAYSYEEASAVVCYLYPGAMKKLDGLLRGKLTPGAYVISIYFAIPGWEAQRVVTCKDLYRTKIYVYQYIDDQEM